METKNKEEQQPMEGAEAPPVQTEASTAEALAAEADTPKKKAVTWCQSVRDNKNPSQLVPKKSKVRSVATPQCATAKPVQPAAEPQAANPPTAPRVKILQRPGSVKYDRPIYESAEKPQHATRAQQEQHEQSVNTRTPQHSGNTRLFMLSTNEQRIAILQQENFALANQVRLLQEQLQHQAAETSRDTEVLLAQLRIKGKAEKGAFQKVNRMEESLRAEVQRRKDLEASLAREGEEVKTLKMALAQATKNLEHVQCQWQQDASRLLAERVEEASSVKEALTQAKDGMEKERLQWRAEKAALLNIHSSLEKTVKEEQEKRRKAEECLAREAEEASKVKIALAQAKQDTERIQCQWENDISRLLAEQVMETSILKVGLIHAEEDMEKERLRWKEEKDAFLKRQNELDKAVKAEEQNRKEAEASLAREADENTKIKIALAQVTKDLERHKCQSAMDINCLQDQLAQDTSNLKASLVHAEEQLQKERVDWQIEKSSLLDSVNILRQELDAKEEERRRWQEEQLERLEKLEDEMNMGQNKPKKKKKSLRKRFLNIFKRSGGAESQTDPSTSTSLSPRSSPLPTPLSTEH